MKKQDQILAEPVTIKLPGSKSQKENEKKLREYISKQRPVAIPSAQRREVSKKP